MTLKIVDKADGIVGGKNRWQGTCSGADPYTNSQERWHIYRDSKNKPSDKKGGRICRANSGHYERVYFQHWIKV